jgi:polysaccharide biosynthesis protein PslH
VSRILLLTPQLPFPPRQGASLRNFNIIRGLAQRHALHLLTFGAVDGQGTQEALEVLNRLCESVEVVPALTRGARRRLSQLVFSPLPDIAWRLRQPAFEEALTRTLKKTSPDLVQIEGLELAGALPAVRQHSPGTKVIFDDHNAEAELQRRTFHTDLRSPGRWHGAAYSYVQARRLANYERWACLEADAVVVVSDADAGHIRSLAPSVSPTVITNSIDVESYSRARAAVDFYFDLVFTGKMDYRPNVDAMLWFGDKIWPAILAHRPETTLAIVGQTPHRRLKRLAAMPGVTVTGWVDAVQPYFAAASVFVTPFRVGSGTRLKLIEAMASGCAIVSTSVGVEGYPVVHTEHLLLADKPDLFAAEVLRLLDQPALRSALGMAAERFARQYDWRQVSPRFDGVYKVLLKGRDLTSSDG